MKIIQSKKTYTIITGFVSKLTVAFTQFLGIKLVTESLGLENYAVFAILTGMIGWYLLAELGLGPALQNYVSKMRVVSKDYSSTLTAVFVSVVGIWIIFILILFVFKDIIGEALLIQFELNSYSKGEFVFLVSSLYTSMATFSIVYKVWFSEEQGYLSNIFQLIASVLGLMGLVFVLKTDLFEHKLYASLFAFVFPLAALPFIVFISRINIWHIDLSLFKSFIKEVNFKVIAKFWILTVLAMLVVQVDIFVISQLSESSDIVVYVVVSKIFTLGYFIYASYMQMLWPVFSEQIHKSNWIEVNAIISKNIVFFFIVYVIGFIGMYFILDDILRFLAGNEELAVSFSLFMGFVLLTIVRIWTDMYATLLQSINELDFFIYAIAFQALISVFCQWELTKSYGVEGVVYGMLISYLLTVAWVLPARYYFLYRRNKVSGIG